jgi:hypothetical protein
VGREFSSSKTVLLRRTACVYENEQLKHLLFPLYVVGHYPKTRKEIEAFCTFFCTADFLGGTVSASGTPSKTLRTTFFFYVDLTNVSLKKHISTENSLLGRHTFKALHFQANIFITIFNKKLSFGELLL